MQTSGRYILVPLSAEHLVEMLAETHIPVCEQTSKNVPVQHAVLVFTYAMLLDACTDVFIVVEWRQTAGKIRLGTLQTLADIKRNS